MLNRLNYFIMLAGLLVLVACSSNSGKQVEVANTPFVYDGLKEYPVKELKLSDLAVSDYVLLKDDENSLLGRLPTNPCMQVTEDRIYIQDEEQQAVHCPKPPRGKLSTEESRLSHDCFIS